MKTLILLLALLSLATAEKYSVTLERPGVADLPLGTWELHANADGTIDGQLYIVSDFKRYYLLSIYDKPLAGYELGYEITWALPVRKVGRVPVGGLQVVWEWGVLKEIYPVVRNKESHKIWNLTIKRLAPEGT